MQGICKLESGLTVLVDNALPGEHLEACLTTVKKRKPCHNCTGVHHQQHLPSSELWTSLCHHRCCSAHFCCICGSHHVRLSISDMASNAGYATATRVKVLRPHDHLVQPPCPYFGTCGGCALQNLAYSAQLAQKDAQVTASPGARGLFAHPTASSL